MRRSALLIVLFVVTVAPGMIVSTGPVAADDWHVTVRGGESDLGETPVVTEIPGSITKGNYQLRPDVGCYSVGAQVFEQGQKRFLAFVLPQLAGSQTTGFSLEPRAGEESGSAKPLSVHPEGKNLLVNLDGKPLTKYRVDSGSKPIFFPLIGPTGDRYTRAYPMETIDIEDRDHPHQRSCWFTHGKVNGIDFWAEGAKMGTIKETQRTIVTEGPALVRLFTNDDWVGPDGKRVCSDERTVTFYHTLQSRIIDFDFNIRASEGPVTFGETKEGMFGVRVASSMDVLKKTGGRITNAEGVTDDKAWGKVSPWVDYVGPVKDKTVGIAVLNHPGSFRYPTAWHVRPYGLFAANPFGGQEFGGPALGEHTVPSGETMAFHYRVILHEGDTKAAGVGRLFAAYAKPPTVEVTQK
jgi:Methane oxygenase PmoA